MLHCDSDPNALAEFESMIQARSIWVGDFLHYRAMNIDRAFFGFGLKSLVRDHPDFFTQHNIISWLDGLCNTDMDLANPDIPALSIDYVHRIVESGNATLVFFIPNNLLTYKASTPTEIKTLGTKMPSTLAYEIQTALNLESWAKTKGVDIILVRGLYDSLGTNGNLT